MGDERSEFSSSDYYSGAVEREFVLMPLLRRMRAGIRSLSGRDRQRAEQGQISPDTIIIYPDRLGNYVSVAEFAEVAKTGPLGEMNPIARQDAAPEVRPQVEAMPERQELPLGLSNLSYFAQHAVETDVRSSQPAVNETPVERASVEPAPVIEAADVQVPEAEPVRETVRPSWATLLLEVTSSPKWGAWKPALGYGAIGFLVFVLMFMLPSMRRPASVLLPVTEATAASGVRSNVAQPAVMAKNTEPGQGGGVTIAIPSNGEISPVRRARPAAGLRSRAGHDAGDDVVVHHYGNSKQEPRVQRASAGVKRYSDMP